MEKSILKTRRPKHNERFWRRTRHLGEAEHERKRMGMWIFSLLGFFFFLSIFIMLIFIL